MQSPVPPWLAGRAAALHSRCVQKLELGKEPKQEVRGGLPQLV